MVPRKKPRNKLKAKYAYYGAIQRRINSVSPYRNEFLELLELCRDTDKAGKPAVYQRIYVIFNEIVDGEYEPEMGRNDGGFSTQLKEIRRENGGLYIPGFLIWLSRYHEEEARKLFARVKSEDGKSFEFIEPPAISKLDEIDERIEAQRAPPTEPLSQFGLIDPRERTKTEETIGQMRYFEQNTKFIGRAREREALRKFMKPDSQRAFVWWQIAGAAGQGKSRLAIQLFEEMENPDQWEFGFVDQFDENFVQKVRDHRSTRNLLIVIDYASAPGKIDLLFELVDAMNEASKSHPRLNRHLRLLAIDRQPYQQSTPDPEGLTLGEMPASWQVELMNPANKDWRVARDALFDQTEPLLLQDPHADELVSIAKDWATFRNREKSLSAKQEATVRQFLGLPGDDGTRAEDAVREVKRAPRRARRPLFAILAAEVVLNGICPSNADDGFETLLEHILDIETRELFWKKGQSSKSADDVLEEQTTATQHHMACFANIVGSYDAYSSTTLALEASGLLSRQPKDIKLARKLLGYSTWVDRRAESIPIVAREPDILAEYQVLRECYPANQDNMIALINAAWSCDGSGTYEFLLRLTGDFPFHPGTQNFLRNVPYTENAQKLWASLAMLYTHYYGIQKPLWKYSEIKDLAEYHKIPALMHLQVWTAFNSTFLFCETGRLSDAYNSYSELSGLAAVHGDDPLVRGVQAKAVLNLSLYLCIHGAFKEALGVLHDLIGLVEQYPNEPSLREILAGTLKNLIEGYRAASILPVADSLFLRLSKLSTDHPEETLLRRYYAEAAHIQALAWCKSGSLSKAHEFYDLIARMASTHADEPMLLDIQGHTGTKLIELYLAYDQHSAASALHSELSELFL